MLYETMENYQVNFRIAGDKSQLPSELISFLEEKEKKFRFPSSLKTLVLAINYGGQDEIIRAAQKLQKQHQEITKESLESTMDF
jgi:di-trans,poly-cis-decaprenylcistransferase